MPYHRQRSRMYWWWADNGGDIIATIAIVILVLGVIGLGTTAVALFNGELCK